MGGTEHLTARSRVFYLESGVFTVIILKNNAHGPVRIVLEGVIDSGPELFCVAELLTSSLARLDKAVHGARSVDVEENRFVVVSFKLSLCQLK